MGYTDGLYVPKLAVVLWNPLALVVQDLAVLWQATQESSKHSMVKTIEQEHISGSMYREVHRDVAKLRNEQLLDCYR